MSAATFARAVLFDRDGTLTRLVSRDGTMTSPRRAADLELHDDSARAVRRLRAHGFGVFVITNQPDVARGHLPPAELDAMSARVRDAIQPDEIVVCPHDDHDRCGCRKPAPGMILGLAERWQFAPDSAWVVGDSWRDVQAASAAGCRSVLLVRDGMQAPDGTEGAEATVATLDEAVAYILDRATTPASRA